MEYWSLNSVMRLSSYKDDASQVPITVKAMSIEETWKHLNE